MLGNRGVLPPLDYLLAFEAAATYQSFAVASREMNISESAISRKVRLLESRYKVSLFVRGHRSIQLTPQGKMLLDRILPALDSLRSTSMEMLSEHQKNVVTLAATNSVSSLWLMPRLRKFNSNSRRVKIMLVSSDSDDECLGDTVDLSILRGGGNWPGFIANRLFGETIFAVCAPGFLASNPGISSFNSLLDYPLIGVSSIHTEWMNWKTWLRHHGVRIDQIEKAASFNTYPLSIQAAVDGLGIALGWGNLVDHLLDSGELVRPFADKDVITEHGYYLLTPQRKESFPERDIVKDWLLKAGAKRHH